VASLFDGDLRFMRATYVSARVDLSIASAEDDA
jgi:hypothetical protein